MRKVAVIGIGQTIIDEHWGKSLRELAGEAIFAALNDAGREWADNLYVSNMMSGLLSKQENLGALLADWIGFRGIDAVKIEAACGSGGAAVRAGIFAVASGQSNSALVVGVEKMSESPSDEVTAALATAADADWEAAQGLSFVALNALLMQRYLYEYGWNQQDFAPFSINAHENALSNPYARLHSRITLEDYARARHIAEPINLLDASPTGDGAAALLLVPADELDGTRITFAGSASATDTLAIHSRRNGPWLTAAEESANTAYNRSGFTPTDIDVFESHDAFSIMAALSLEACGFAAPGQGPRLALEGDIRPAGRIPVATRGGLKARGHPVGATGVYQVVEVIQQLRGDAGDTQVEGARIGMAQNIGGSGATIITHILEREN